MGESDSRKPCRRMEDLNQAFEFSARKLIAYVAKINVIREHLKNADRTALIRSYASQHFILEISRRSKHLKAHLADQLELDSDFYYDRKDSDARKTVMGNFCDRCLFEVRAMALHAEIDDEEYAHLRALCFFNKSMSSSNEMLLCSVTSIPRRHSSSSPSIPG